MLTQTYDRWRYVFTDVQLPVKRVSNYRHNNVIAEEVESMVIAITMAS